MRWTSWGKISLRWEKGSYTITSYYVKWLYFNENSPFSKGSLGEGRNMGRGTEKRKKLGNTQKYIHLGQIMKLGNWSSLWKFWGVM
jgi:hypothetical protein